MNKTTRLDKQVRFPGVASVALLGLCLSAAVLAEDKVWEIKPGHVLGKIVAENYPGYTNRKAIIQEIIKRNPEAFVGQDANRLIVGKSIKLPAASDIPDLQPPPPPKAEGGVDKASQEKIQALETEVKDLKETVALLEEENASLQTLLDSNAQTKPAEPVAPTAADADLQAQLDAAKQEAQDSQAKAKALEGELATANSATDTLRNEVEKLRAATAVAASKDSSSSSLPWILLGLLALLTLPLIWLLRRKQGETAPVVARVEKAAEVAVVAAPPAPMPLAEPPAAAEVQVAATPAQPVAAVPENPDAALKLDIARAYLDLRDSTAAADILQDVLVEGGDQQRLEAREILSFIS